MTVNTLNIYGSMMIKLVDFHISKLFILLLKMQVSLYCLPISEVKCLGLAQFVIEVCRLYSISHCWSIEAVLALILFLHNVTYTQQKGHS